MHDKNKRKLILFCLFIFFLLKIEIILKIIHFDIAEIIINHYYYLEQYSIHKIYNTHFGKINFPNVIYY